MQKPLVSIITVVYNNQQGIAATIQSVQQQSYAPIEYIVIDGGSTDGTRDIISQYQSVISRSVSEPDQGIYDAMNKGISMAGGELIAIVNSGDYLEPHAVQTVVSAMEADPEAEVYHGLLRVFSESGEPMHVIGNHSSFLSTGMIEHPTCFVRKSVYARYGVFDLAYRSSADYEFMLRIWLQQVRFHFIENILVNFFAGGMSSKPVALLETISIRHRYGLISTAKKHLFINFTRLRFALKK